jgi:heat shock protein HslJ
MRMPGLISCFGLAIALMGCKDFGSEKTPPDWSAYVINKTWTLYALTDNGDPVPVLQGQPYRLTFEDRENLLLQVHCNSCFGTYRMGAGGSLEIQVLSCTKMLCPPPSLSGIFENALRRASAYRIEDHTLIIEGDNGRTQMRFFQDIR